MTEQTDENEITDPDGKHWCTSEDVRDKIDIPQKGEEVPHHKSIRSATETVQVWWNKATGKDITESNLPDPDDLPFLLREACAFQAASESHMKFTRQIRADDDDARPHYVFLERKAKSKFDDWKAKENIEPGDENRGQVRGSPVRTGSLLDLGDSR